MRSPSEIAKSVRKSVVTMAHASRASHTGSALSIIDILVVLYDRILDVDPANPGHPSRDRFILSKGHASAALYATLAEFGFFDRRRLSGFYQNGGSLPGHVDHTVVPGLETAAGSLGHGLSLGIGMALALRMDQPKARVYVLVGDGELNEGSLWEAIMFAPHAKLANMTLVVDCNGLQGYGDTKAILDLQPLGEKLASFGWDVCSIDGHDFDEINSACSRQCERPRAILAETVKGKGVSYMENEFIWHYRSPDDEQLKQALEELE